MSEMLGAQRRKKSLFREYAEALVMALLLAMVIRTFVVQSFKIPSESMMNTLLVGDYLLGEKFTYGLKIPFTDITVYEGRDPQRGEVVIFAYPKDPSLDFIKRIVGIPGDVIEVRNKQLYRNNEPVQESYARFTDPDNIFGVRDDFGPVTVPEGHYFMMGDNRDNSQDSRFWGFVSRDAIRARAWRIYWSWNAEADGFFNAIRFDRLGKAIE
ncbi:signal peptidase I [uncultured Desulfovibrio sp.]|uniref:signal peptidase I n=1 Tax=uncultured Desulfovibrio sp. TaxID=167968 RepID=UPI0026076225|nr:signal peptidase I [uncultured Desulfovibrio sp.]